MSEPLRSSPLNLKRKYDVFVETGTWKGNSIALILKENLAKEIHSIECDERFYEYSKNRFMKNKNVHLYYGYSSDYLETIINKIPKDKMVLWWLDAHYPVNEENLDSLLPLQHELDIIVKNRNVLHDHVLCDDYRIYEKITPEKGNLNETLMSKKKLNLTTWKETHEIIISKKRTGYLYLKPLKEKL